MIDSLPIIFINCTLFPFIQWIIQGIKVYETRDKNTLKRYLGKTVYLCKTGGKEKVIYCKATIQGIVKVESKVYYEKFRKDCCIVPGCKYDFTGKRKYLYLLTDIVPVNPFVPYEGKHNGYTSMEFNGIKKYL